MNQPQIKEALEKGIRAARRGRKEPAQRLLGQVVQAEPNNEEAWLWLARVVDQPSDRAACLQRVIEINPNNSWAVEQLAELQNQPSQVEAQTPSMTAESDLEISVMQCPNCGTPFEIHSDDIKSITCNGCQDILDLTQDQLEVLGQNNPSIKPLVPIDLGMEGTFWGETHQVIGWLRYEGRGDGETWQWDEWLMHSASGDLRWLSYSPEEGFTIYKPLEPTAPFDPRMATVLPVPGGQAYVVERAQATIKAIKGEFTWRANVGDEIGYIDAERGDATYSVEYNDEEIDLLGGRRMSEDKVWKTFGREDLASQAKSYKARTSPVINWKPVFGWAALYSFIIMVLAIFIGGCVSNSGSQLYTTETSLSRGETSTRTVGPIRFETDSRVHRLTLEAKTLPSNPVRVNVAMVDSEQKAETSVSLTTKQFRTGGENSLSYLFKPRSRYTQVYLVLTLQDTPPEALPLTVRIEQGVWDASFFFFAATIAFLAGGSFIVLWIIQLFRGNQDSENAEEAPV
ncbi:MAG: hypothetical protein AAF629_04360 [Chloroflexota bacterium]